MGVIAERIVGRAAELEAVDRGLAQLRDGRPALLEVVGEPGIGKTRLLAELGARADALGHLVLSGSASELERDLPFSVFVDALDEYVESLEPGEIGRLSGETLGELATVLPSLSDHGLAQRAAVEQERFRSHRAVRELLDLLATPQPLVLLLDDLHGLTPARSSCWALFAPAFVRRSPARVRVAAASGPGTAALAARARASKRHAHSAGARSADARGSRRASTRA